MVTVSGRAIYPNLIALSSLKSLIREWREIGSPQQKRSPATGKTKDTKFACLPTMQTQRGEC